MLSDDDANTYATHYMSLLFTKLSPPFPAQKAQRRQPRGFIKPGVQHRVRAQAGGLAGKYDEDGLGDFLGLGGNPDMTQRRRINEGDVALHQAGKGGFRALPVVIPHQFHVAGIVHLPIYCRWTRNQAVIFLVFSAPVAVQKRRRAAAFQDAGAKVMAPACTKRLANC